MIMSATCFQTSYFVDAASVCPGHLGRSPEASCPAVLCIVSWPLAPSHLLHACCADYYQGNYQLILGSLKQLGTTPITTAVCISQWVTC